ncbi:MAG: P-loop containing nucleoside triphosphate hydrolase protein [Benjaminiella poitrasii]|nr:MAG: P-loop containing nucleoside triphosphate hydrolase protein [Benjaminiella poitrasii]
MAPLEIIGAGFGRTGTDSLRTALNMLGYKTHHMKSFGEDLSLDPDDFYHAYLHRDEANWEKMYENYNAAVDWPTTSFYKELYAKYPDAKVILTVRDADSWYTSMLNTLAHRSHAPPKGDVDPTKNPRFKFQRMASTVCMNGLTSKPDEFDDKERMKKIFLDHNEEVKRLIPADKLLVFELENGWEKLCSFLGKEIPDVPYPHINTTAQHQEYVKKMLSRQQGGKPNN